MIAVARWLVAAPVVIAGCVSPTIGGCIAIAPSSLPDGSPPLQARLARDDTGAEIAAWGQGASEVQQAARRLRTGEAEACAEMTVIFNGDCYPIDPPQVHVRGHTAVVFSPVSSLDQHFVDWVEGGCVYEVRLPAGMPSQQAIDYAGRY